MIIQAKQLTEFFKHMNTAIGIIYNNDANRERSVKVTRVIQCVVACYKELYSERQKAAWQLSQSLVEESQKLSIHWLCKTAGPD
jgi:hypothetical protein